MALKLKITVEGKVYEVEVEVADPEPAHPNPMPTHARMPAAKPAAAVPVKAAPIPVANESKVCRSPISGVVVRIPVQAGQTIRANDVLMVLEAMKMETTITAPFDGKLAKVNVNVGDGVTGGQVLVEFE